MGSGLLGIYGGTFDPIHLGHLHAAKQVLQKLSMDEIRVVVSANPPHRHSPVLPAEQRLVLVERALEGQAGLVVEGCELRREGPSYMADTLLALRQQMPGRPIALILGMDAFNGLKSWHNWQQIIELAHIVVTDRPNANVNLNKAVDASLKDFVEDRQVFSKEQLNQAPSGLLYIQYVRPLNISATEIREQLNQSRSVQRLVPEQVWLEIKENHLYGFDKE
jgi:nicotinate-nucleotide adenylyltransferase